VLRDDEPYSRTKDVHIRVCLGQNVESARTTGLEKIRLLGGLPDFGADEMDVRCQFLGKTLQLPLLIAPITGGGKESARINRNLAEAAERTGIGMAVGSEAAMLERKAARESFMVRQFAPTVPLLANLGLIHAKKGRDYFIEAVEAIQGDAITVYVNPLHEILQQDGERDFRGALDALGSIAEGFPFPIFLKEVGFGLPDSLSLWAHEREIAGVDVAGLGGTNWARIEGFIQGREYALYEQLGTPTRDAIICAQRLLKHGQYLIASGGIRTGIDMAKAFALGAHLAAMALPFLRWADESTERVVQAVQDLKSQLVVALWHCGCRSTADLLGKLLTEA
jgi:isopentenyl-diphosphate delta-isomerase